MAEKVDLLTNSADLTSILLFLNAFFQVYSAIIFFFIYISLIIVNYYIYAVLNF